MEKPPANLQMPKISRRIKHAIIAIVFLLMLLQQKQEVFAEELQKNAESLDTILGEEGKDLGEYFLEDTEPISYTAEDEKLLATVIYAEAAGCSDMEKRRVGNVVLNRIQDTTNTFPNTLKEVVYQDNQFTCVGGKLWRKGPTEAELQIARDLLNGQRVLTKNIVWFSKKCYYGKVYYVSDWHEYAGW